MTGHWRCASDELLWPEMNLGGVSLIVVLISFLLLFPNSFGLAFFGQQKRGHGAV
jgi:hypothetical protein